MKKYKGFLVDDDLNIYSARTKRKLTPYIGSDGYFQVAYRDENQKNNSRKITCCTGKLFYRESKSL